MKATLLGTSTAIGMPAPLCSCQYCQQVNRTRPSLFIQTQDKNILFDVSPDINKQSHNRFENIDGVFLTHHHHDHATGIRELNHTTLKPERVVMEGKVPSSKIPKWLSKEYDIHCSSHVKKHLLSDMSYIFERDNMNIVEVSDTQSIDVGNLEIIPFIAEHCLGYLGYVIKTEDRKIVYHPDYGKLRTDVKFDNVDTLITDVSSILGYNIHGTEEQFNELVKDVNPDEILGTNVSEHLSQENTNSLKEKVSGTNIKIVSDGYTF